MFKAFKKRDPSKTLEELEFWHRSHEPLEHEPKMIVASAIDG